MKMLSLFDAVRDRNIPLLRQIVEGGANINARNGHGFTSLMLACESNCREMSAYLARRSDVDVHIKNGFGKNALYFALKSGLATTIKILVQRGAVWPYTICNKPVLTYMLLHNLGHLISLFLCEPYLSSYELWETPLYVACRKPKYFKYAEMFLTAGMRDRPEKSALKVLKFRINEKFILSYWRVMNGILDQYEILPEDTFLNLINKTTMSVPFIQKLIDKGLNVATYRRQEYIIFALAHDLDCLCFVRDYFGLTLSERYINVYDRTKISSVLESVIGWRDEYIRVKNLLLAGATDDSGEARAKFKMSSATPEEKAELLPLFKP